MNAVPSTDRPSDAGAFLRELPLLAGLAEEDLAQLVTRARRITVAAGELVMEEGTPGDGLYVVMHGELEVTRREGDQEVVLAVYGPGVFLGEMSLVEQVPRSASVRAVYESELLVIEPAEFQALLATSPMASLTIMRTIASRLRSTEASLLQHAKLASLGTLAAGLAHELNNPAAAMRRSTARLREALDDWDRSARRLGTLQLEAHRLELLDAIDNGAAPGRPHDSDPLATLWLEDELSKWLRARGIEGAASIVAPLLSCGWTPARLESPLADLPVEQSRVLLHWLASRCEAYTLLDEVARSAGMVSEIVGAVRSYSFLGQAPVQEVDVRDGLENTLVILRSKWKDGIRVVRHFAPELPRIEAYGSELNQVWTNLIDNAIDAMQGRGVLQLRARQERDGIVVEVEDDGPGIPASICPRIFDPFFTTKPPGAGSGLGLHIAHNIVRKHRGRIRVDSVPGRTLFQVFLPVRLSGASRAGRERDPRAD